MDARLGLARCAALAGLTMAAAPPLAAQQHGPALARLEEVIQLEGPQTIAAFILEPVSGTNGVLVPPDGYLQSIREVCDRHGILLIADEVMAGFGRTGTWFGVDNWGVVPDIITLAKGINSGYVPLGAMANWRAGLGICFRQTTRFRGMASVRRKGRYLTMSCEPLGARASVGPRGIAKVGKGSRAGSPGVAPYG